MPHTYVTSIHLVIFIMCKVEVLTAVTVITVSHLSHNLITSHMSLVAFKFFMTVSFLSNFLEMRWCKEVNTLETQIQLLESQCTETGFYLT